MTPCELAERDLNKANLNLANALKKPNVSPVEIEHLEKLCELRKTILEIIHQG